MFILRTLCFQESIPLQVASPKSRLGFTQCKGDYALCVCLGAYISVCLGLEAIHSLSCRGLFAEYQHGLLRTGFIDFQSCRLIYKLYKVCLGVAMVIKHLFIRHNIAFFSISFSDFLLSVLICDTVRCLVT